MGKEEFINNYKRNFASNNELKLKFEMGGKMNGEKRVNQVLQRFEEISNYIFKNKEIWVFLIIWDANGENKKELINSGFDKTLASNCYYGKVEDGLIIKENFSEDAFEDAEIRSEERRVGKEWRTRRRREQKTAYEMRT